MGSVAAAMKSRGYKVTGSDQNVYPPMSTFLSEQGVEVMSGYRAENVPDDADVIIVGNAISRGNEEAETVLEKKLLYTSLPELLKNYFLRGKRNYVVSGTHGKTTTTSILTWIFKSAGHDPSHMIGGVPKNLGRGASFTDSDFVVLEGDEYDTAFFDKRSKFLHYLPEVVIINNIEFDHADIYDSLDEIKLTFSRLLKVVPRNGLAYINGDDPNCLEVAQDSPAPVTTVGFGEACDLKISEVDYQPGSTSFTLGEDRYMIPMVGEFNVRNAAMSAAAAKFAGLSVKEIQVGLETFTGIARRQELKGEVNGVKVVDDFAHHPTAIGLAIQALRQQYPEARLWAIFEPRSNTTRRNIFQNELADALCLADRAIIPSVPDAGKIEQSDLLCEKTLEEDVNRRGGKAIFLETVDEIVSHVVEEAQPGDVVAVLSNGGFEGIHEKLLTRLARK